MECEFGRTIIIVTLSLLISILSVFPEVHFAIFSSTHQNLLLCRMPFEHGDLLFVEAHVVQMVIRHALIPDGNRAILS